MLKRPLRKHSISKTNECQWKEDKEEIPRVSSTTRVFCGPKTGSYKGWKKVMSACENFIWTSNKI